MIDTANATELVTFADNTQPHYRHLVSCYQNLQRKIKRGVYDRAKAVDLFVYVATDAAKAYVKEYCGPSTVWHSIFSVEDRRAAAAMMRDAFEAEIEAGNSWL